MGLVEAVASGAVEDMTQGTEGTFLRMHALRLSTFPIRNNQTRDAKPE